MCIQISAFNTPRQDRVSVQKCQTVYKLQPWGETSTHLPMILRKNKNQRNSTIDESKKKLKIRALFDSHDAYKQSDRQQNKSIQKIYISNKKVNRQKSTNSFSQARNQKHTKYSSNILKVKTIKNFNISEELGNTSSKRNSIENKQKIDKKISKKLLTINKNTIEQENEADQDQNTNCAVNRFSTVQDSGISLAKIQKRIELQRKIFIFLSRDRL